MDLVISSDNHGHFDILITIRIFVMFKNIKEVITEANKHRNFKFQQQHKELKPLIRNRNNEKQPSNVDLVISFYNHGLLYSVNYQNVFFMFKKPLNEDVIPEANNHATFTFQKRQTTVHQQIRNRNTE